MRTNLVADASSSAEPLMQHVNAAGETVATAGGDGGGPDGGPCAPANVGTCDPKYWSCPGAAGYKVRGQTYLKVRPSYSSLAPGPPPCPCHQNLLLTCALASNPSSRFYQVHKIQTVWLGPCCLLHLPGSAETDEQS